MDYIDFYSTMPVTLPSVGNRFLIIYIYWTAKSSLTEISDSFSRFKHFRQDTELLNFLLLEELYSTTDVMCL
jgi:hypothetical protein